MSLDPRCGAMFHACHDEPAILGASQRPRFRAHRRGLPPFVNRRTRVGPAPKRLGPKQIDYLCKTGR